MIKKKISNVQDKKKHKKHVTTHPINERKEDNKIEENIGNKVNEDKEKMNDIENKNQMLLKNDEKTGKVENKKIKDESNSMEIEIQKDEENEELIKNKSTKKDLTKDTKHEFDENNIPPKKYRIPLFNNENPILKKDDPNYVRKLEIELEQEKRQRKYYQKLCKKLEKKNKELCFQLLGKSINPQNTFNLEIDSNNDSNISGALMNNIHSMSNVVSPGKRFKNRSLTEYKIKDESIKISQKEKQSSKSIYKRENKKRRSRFKKLHQKQFETYVSSKKAKNNNYNIAKIEKSKTQQKSHINDSNNSNINISKIMSKELDLKNISLHFCKYIDK